MTEAETMGVLIGLNDASVNTASVWISVTFAYLTVAYFVGATLSRFQCLTVSALYTSIAAVFGGSATIHVYAWQLTASKEMTVYGRIDLANSLPGWVGGCAFSFVAGTLVSLYFMYNVRRTKAA